MGLIYSAGPLFNFAARGVGALTMSSENALFLKANAIDGQGDRPAIFNAAAVDDYIKKDVNAITNPDFETSPLTGWTARSLGTGTAAETAVAGEFHGGALALKLTGSDSSNYGAESQDFSVMPGEFWKVDLWARVVAAGNAKFVVQNLQTGKYLTTGGVWQAAFTHCILETGTSYANKTLTFQIEDFDACQVASMTLRVMPYCDSGTACFDDILLLPGINFASVHGHNLGPIAPLFQWSDDDSSYTTAVTGAPKRPTFYQYNASGTLLYHRYWRQLLQGTNLTPAYIGEWCLLQASALVNAQLWGYSTKWGYSQVRHDSMGGDKFRFLMASDPARSITLSFQPYGSNQVEYKELRDVLFRLHQGGTYACVLVPLDTEPDVLLAVPGQELEITRTFQSFWEADYMFDELPHPIVGL